MIKPLAPWNDDGNFIHEKLVWLAQLDNRYQVEVHHTGENTGNLYIFDHEDNNKELVCFPVNLSNGTASGADIANVEEWMQMSENFVDGKNKDPN